MTKRMNIRGVYRMIGESWEEVGEDPHLRHRLRGYGMCIFAAVIVTPLVIAKIWLGRVFGRG